MIKPGDSALPGTEPQIVPAGGECGQYSMPNL